MEIVGREGPPVFLKKAAARLIRFPVRVHADFAGKPGTLEEIAGAAGCHHVLPGCLATLGAGNDVIECQFMRWQSVMAVLTRKIVPQEHIKARESRFAG